ncbi:hypothetical protein ABZ345_10255 [Lentzea sp. NPDC005914]|uniref:hypothetical protein n=1 Tax=Lentzea sp. NPDC005914 TaxID=3154572 RepID=UPI0033E6B049
MIRKTTAAALVLSAVPAALALSLFSGTAQADDTPWGKTGPGGTTSGAVIASDDTPWGRGITTSDDDAPWGKAITLPAIPNDDTPWDDDTPWG